MALVPAEAAEEFLSILSYDAPPADSAAWLSNGKISDISCAFLIDRLEQVDDWAPRYREQARRVAAIAAEAGLRPLQTDLDAPPATSWAFLSETPVSAERIGAAPRLTFAKYYKPLADLPNTRRLFAHLVNIPTHPDVARLSDAELASDIEDVLAAPEELRRAS